MQIDAQTFLPLVEKAGGLCFLDIEATGLKADYNSILVVTVKPWHRKPITFSVRKPGDDKQVVLAAKQLLEKYVVWSTYYGKMFDVPMIQSRLLFHNLPPLESRHHLDLYWLARGRFLTARRSQAHLIEWLGTPHKKMTLSPDQWNIALKKPREGITTLRQRCEKDCAGLEGLYDRTKHLVKNIAVQ